MDHRMTIVNALDAMRKKETADGQTFKARAYAKVIDQLKVRLVPIVTEADVADIEGIGEKIRAKIVEILTTGTLRAADKAKITHAVQEEITGVYGIGPVKAKELIDVHGVVGIDSLREAAIATPGLLNTNQTVGLKYYDDLRKRIPRAEMDKHCEQLMQQTVALVPPGLALAPSGLKLAGVVVGSFRRGAKDSGDIDMLLTMPPTTSDADQHATFRAFVSALQKSGYIQEILAHGDKKCMAICVLPPVGKSKAVRTARRLDLLLTPHDQFPYALLYFTGCDTFNIAFRGHALSRGYTLNEHALTVVGSDATDVPHMNCERDIFDFLGLEFKEPCDRKGPADVIVVSAVPMTTTAPMVTTHATSAKKKTVGKPKK